MKVLFLDFDGVLNDIQWLHHGSQEMAKLPFGRDSHALQLDPSKVLALNRIVEETGAEVVISSTWRRTYDFKDLSRILIQRGFKHYLGGVLPVEEDYGVKKRGEAINRWLEENPDVTHYVIVDDDIDEHMKNFVQTNSYTGGMTHEKTQEIIAMLNGDGSSANRVLNLEPGSVEMTCFACPSQWSAQTVEGAELYVRYRYGGLRIDLDGETIHRDTLGDGLDGVCSWEDVVQSAANAGIVIRTED